jgi:ABC-type polysaccharide/polyol phosphate transport system, ATPase component
MSKPIIEVSGVSKKYRLGQIGMTTLRDDLQRLGRRLRGHKDAVAHARDFWALNDVNFQVQPGEVIGVVGRNGAGKSTLLKILSRITEPTTGEIVLRGRLASLLEVGTGFHRELSGRDNIYLNGAILGMNKFEISRKFDEIVDFAEIGQFIDTPVKRYSSGMYVKLAFAIAAHLEPEILIVDEVLAVGDAAFQRKCINKMQSISTEQGRTILFVSHAVATIRRLCQRCLYLEKGRSLGIMTTDEAIERYSTTGISTELDIDVSTRKRDWGTDGSEARILRVTTRTAPRFKQPLEVEFLVQAARPLEKLMLGFTFNMPDGQRILTLDSDGDGQTFSLPQGRSLIRLRLPNLPLHPTRYNVSAAIGAGKHFHDIIDNFALWEVQTSSTDFESDRSFGGARITPEIVIQPAAAPS